MATFEKRDFPEISRTAYLITDDYGHTAELTLAQANYLLEWLYQQRQALEQATPWYEETPAEFLAGFDEIIEVHHQGQQRVKPAHTRQWKRYRGTLLQCLEKAASIYAYTTQEDQGNIDWRVQTWRLKQRDKDTFTPAELLERIRQDPEQATLPAILDYDSAWFGETVYPDDGPAEGLWVHARLYIVGIDQIPAAIIYRIDFEDEYEENQE
ncbi:MAG TPA: hypothetical protein VKV40_10850 [Ktedonobacteraceae bacterium]|nr:hypothetical protein [Ktedonobacteraceae bacterium]